MLEVILVWVVAVLWNLVANQMVAVLGHTFIQDKRPLTDVAHLILPRLHLGGTPEGNAASALLHVWSAVPAYTAMAHGHLLPWLVVHALISFLRPLCFLSTLLPDASGTGQRPSFFNIRGGVHDLMFSGHTATSLAGVCVLWPTDAAPYVLGSLLLGTACQSFMILATRNHYSVDVVVAWIVVPLLAHWAHTHNYWQASV